MCYPREVTDRGTRSLRLNGWRAGVCKVQAEVCPDRTGTSGLLGMRRFPSDADAFPRRGDIPVPAGGCEGHRLVASAPAALIGGTGSRCVRSVIRGLDFVAGWTWHVLSAEVTGRGTRSLRLDGWLAGVCKEQTEVVPDRTRASGLLGIGGSLASSATPRKTDPEPNVCLSWTFRPRTPWAHPPRC